MNARHGQARVCEDEERLPMFHRTIRLPSGLWQAVKRRGERDGKAIRWVIDDALDADLIQLIERLRKLGFRGERRVDKLVRAPLDDNVIGRIDHGRRQAGLPAVRLLRVCLEWHVAGRARSRRRR